MLRTRFVKVDVNMRDIVMRVLMKMEITSFAECLDRGADAQTNDHERNGKFKVALGPETEVLEAPRGKDIDAQMIVDLRRMLRQAGFAPGDGTPTPD